MDPYNNIHYPMVADDRFDPFDEFDQPGVDDGDVDVDPDEHYNEPPNIYEPEYRYVPEASTYDDAWQ